MRHRWWLTAAAAIPLVASALAGFGSAAQASGARHAAQAITSTGPGLGGGRTGLAAGDPFCKRLGQVYQASAAAQAYCFGARTVGKVQPAAAGAVAGTPRNVDAASFSEDVSPAGVRGFGQSEESIAASGRFVVEAWNDSTTFFSTCGAKNFKEEGTGIGFSTNGGKTFTDLGGLPNPNCTKRVYAGDPSVTAYRAGGHTFFYVASLYLPSFSGFFFGGGPTRVAFDPCEVIGAGSSARLRCGRPVIAASSTQCARFHRKHFHFAFCSFLDKDFVAIDPVRGRLYVSYSEFPVLGFADLERMTVCDLGTRAGRAGPAGGTPARPVCKHGTPLVQTTKLHGHLFEGKAYFTVAPKSRLGCLNEGTYPAVNLKTGAVYVAYEHNWFTNLFFPQCFSSKTPTRDVVTNTPFHCLKLHVVAACKHPARSNGVNVISLDSAFIPGYLRFPAADFPRLAVSNRHDAVSLVWNDSRDHPNGDIMLQSFRLGKLARIQRTPTVLDRPHNGGLTFMPALRVATRSGLLDVAWYSRASAATSDTAVRAATGVSPVATATPRNITITNRTTNWLQNDSDIIPNFGDYIDTVISATGHWPFVGRTWYVAWADGRSGIAQPFEAHLRAG
jgi:hypothetical protein